MKSDVTEDKRTQLAKLIERDFRRGPQFRREEIEEMMKDKNFASTYADLDKYKNLHHKPK